MSTDHFLFIAVCFLILPFQELQGSQIEMISILTCATLIMTLGVSHGAIDNVLFQLNHRVGNPLFITGYLVVIGFNLAFWYFSPELAMLMFLVISAYHFGQSQLNHLNISVALLHKLLNFLWGASLLTALIHFNRSEILASSSEFSILELQIFDFLVQNSRMLWISATLLCFVPLAVIEILVNRKTKELIFQVYVMAIIVIAFTLFSTLVGFTLYFTFLHSLRVLMQEYGAIRLQRKNLTIRSFVILLLPFTLLSIASTAGIVGLHLSIDWGVSTGILMFVLISSITLPHSMVMEAFYNRLAK